jgi:hypothetical protein
MNGIARNFMRLPSADRCLLIKTSFLLIVITVGLSVLPFRTFKRFMVRVTAVSKEVGTPDDNFLDCCAWAVETVSSYVPEAKCLAQAITMQVLLARRGYAARLRIGVTRDEKSMFKAHAWLESNGTTIFGESDTYYAPLRPLEGEPQ